MFPSAKRLQQYQNGYYFIQLGWKAVWGLLRVRELMFPCSNQTAVKGFFGFLPTLELALIQGDVLGLPDWENSQNMAIGFAAISTLLTHSLCLPLLRNNSLHILS